MARSLFGKSRSKDKPYAIYRGRGPFGNTEVLVLKTYQSVEAEKKNPYARWFVAVKSDFTYGSHDMGDNYIQEAIYGLKCVQADPEWIEAYQGSGWL